jgi:hypothetical protein
MVFVTASGASGCPAPEPAVAPEPAGAECERPDAEDPRGSAQLLQNFEVSGFEARHLGHSMARIPFLIALT